MKKRIEIVEDKEQFLWPRGVDLTDSFILGWNLCEGYFEIDLELSLWPENPYYEKPKNDEFTCYKKGKLTFTGLKTVQGLTGLISIKPAIDPDGSTDLGSIFSFRRKGKSVAFATDYTELEFECEAFSLVLHN
jgi:hypothetical protein